MARTELPLLPPAVLLLLKTRPIVGQPGSSSIISWVKLRQTIVQLGKTAGFDNVGHCLGLTTGAQISVCKMPSLSTGPAMPLTGAETVQERPLSLWEGETSLLDCGVVYQVSCTHYRCTEGWPGWVDQSIRMLDVFVNCIKKPIIKSLLKWQWVTNYCHTTSELHYFTNSVMSIDDGFGLSVFCVFYL